MDDPISRAIVIEDNYDNRMDILIGVRGMDASAMERCVSTQLLGSSIRIIGAEDLIAMKIFAGGIQDLEDVRGVLQVSGNKVNLGLLRAAAARYGDDTAAKLNELLEAG